MSPNFPPHHSPEIRCTGPWTVKVNFAAMTFPQRERWLAQNQSYLEQVCARAAYAHLQEQRKPLVPRGTSTPAPLP